ncbi:bactofilin family protein [Novosphingobium sp. Leaf2]|uniref:bactofilin family protein n=1 Tax=Novosphingobium sp. Leaf2 TaxID=1735670 RepID=UPI0006F75D12|nr:polymer-forming cytoskeletal protein [Novosphingobium sp. Leaf2]KQM21854.1 cell shape determination protein CcmA [Novosphingobium sp. Leaf2]
MARAYTISRGVAAAPTASTLDAKMCVTGNIETDTDIQVDGCVHGDIACTALVQGEGSEITGAVRAESVRIAGLVRGSVAARDVVILKTARIEGDVAYDALTIEQGARLNGRLSPNATHTPPTVARLPLTDRNHDRALAAE